ncbi:hypothetical protein BGZ51_001472 [Haplosporangium sp. Z 767]|nr:hypothetical protein BGZ51_001472 [Haplosporangium sp. Z 767]
MSSSPFSIPETLSIILSFLDRRDILTVSTVSRAWYEAATRLLWEALLRPSLSHGFYTQLQRNGCHVQRLELILDTEDEGYSVAPIELTRILKYTPRLKSLSLRASNGWIPNMVSALLIVIKDFVAGQLEHLELGIGSLQLDEAKNFFSTLTSLKRLELRMYTTSEILRAISSARAEQLNAFAYNPIIVSLLSGDNPVSFSDEALVSLGKNHSTTLTNLSIVMNNALTSSGLIGFSERCKNLTRLRLSCCRNVASIGTETLIEASPSLTHVLLENMNISDRVFLKLTSTPARCAQLQALSVLSCRGPSSIGVQNVVRSCQNLKELSIHCSPNVWMDVFEEPAWECTGLETLVLRDLSRDNYAIVQDQENAADEVVDPDEPWTRPVTDFERCNMYRQIGRLWRLKELELVGFAFPLKIFELGRTDLDRLQRLCTLRLTCLSTAVTIKEMIWLATQFPRLQLLQLDEGTVSTSLLKDLTDINKKLKVEFVAPKNCFAAPAPSDSESDIEHGNEGQGNHHFESWSSEGDHEPWSLDTVEGIPLGHSDDESEYNSPLDEYDSDPGNDDNATLNSDEGGYMSSLRDSLEPEDYDAYDSDDYKRYSDYSLDNGDESPSPCLSDDEILTDSGGSLNQDISDEDLDSSLLHSDESDRYQYYDDDNDDLPAQDYSDDESVLSYGDLNLMDDDSDNQEIKSDGNDSEDKPAKTDTDDEEDVIGDDTDNEDESTGNDSGMDDGPHEIDTSNEDEPTANDNDDKDELSGDNTGNEDESGMNGNDDEDMHALTDTDDDNEPAWFGIKGEKRHSHSGSDSDGESVKDMADDDDNSAQEGSDYETRPEVDSSEDDRGIIRKDIGDEAASSADDDD